MQHIATHNSKKTVRDITNGFTIIELLIVITIIGILATIVVAAYPRVQSGARDSQRATKATVIAAALEKYYDKNGGYPDCDVMTKSPTEVSTDALAGADPTVLTAPGASIGTNSIACSDPNSVDAFGYIDGGGQFTIKYKEEGTGIVKSIESKHRTGTNTVAGPQSAPSLSVALNSGHVVATITNTPLLCDKGTAQYTIHSFVNGAETAKLAWDATVTTASLVAYDGARYTFQADSRCWINDVVSSDVNTGNEVSYTDPIPAPSAPTITTVTPSTQTTWSWGDVSCAPDTTARYQYRFSTSWGFVSNPEWNVANQNSVYFTTSDTGYTYTVKVRAQCYSDNTTSVWSAEGSTGYYRPVPVVLGCTDSTAINYNSSANTNDGTCIYPNVPATPTVAVSSSDSTTTTWSWNAASCVAGASARYQYRYSTSWGFVSNPEWNTTSGTTVTFTTVDAGYTYTVQAKAQCYYNSTNSAWSGAGSDSMHRTSTIIAYASQSNYTNSFPNTVWYDSGGYTGTLSKNGSSTSNTVQTGGTYTYGNSYAQTDSRSSPPDSLPDTIWYTAGNYSGTLYKDGAQTSNTVQTGGTYTAQDSKFMAEAHNTTMTHYIAWAGCLCGYEHNVWSPYGPTINYNQDGYSGTLSFLGWALGYTTTYPVQGAHTWGYDYIYYWIDGYADFWGQVTRPASDTRTWLTTYYQNYSGTISSPDVDTRTWQTTYTQNYTGSVTK